MNLLEKAKEIDAGQKKQVVITDEHVELCLAFMKGDISMGALSEAIGLKQHSGQSYITVSRALLQAYKWGKIIIK